MNTSTKITAAAGAAKAQLKAAVAEYFAWNSKALWEAIESGEVHAGIFVPTPNSNWNFTADENAADAPRMNFEVMRTVGHAAHGLVNIRDEDCDPASVHRESFICYLDLSSNSLYSTLPQDDEEKGYVNQFRDLLVDICGMSKGGVDAIFADDLIDVDLFFDTLEDEPHVRGRLTEILAADAINDDVVCEARQARAVLLVKNGHRIPAGRFREAASAEVSDVARNWREHHFVGGAVVLCP